VNRKVGVRIVLFFMMYILLFTSATDADVSDSEVATGNIFTATTLDMSQNQTSNNQPRSSLFNVTGMIPGGFEVMGVRIKKEGKMDFNYRLSSKQTAGDNGFCESLNVTWLQNWQVKYQGSLSSLILDDRINEDGVDDWVTLVKFEGDSHNLALKECQFELIFKTWRNDPNEVSGFVDEEVLTNRVSSGNWANE